MIELKRLNRMSEVTGMIIEDMPKDVAALEGKPFNGKNVSEMFGTQAATIAALAGIVKELVDDIIKDQS
jgi:hypothetical protein